MCIIIVKPKGKVIPESFIREQWLTNPDGAGFAVKLEDEKISNLFQKRFYEAGGSVE